MRRFTTTLGCLALIGLPGLLTAQSGATLFRGVRVFDGERVIANTNVLLFEGRIASIGNSRSLLFSNR